MVITNIDMKIANPKSGCSTQNRTNVNITTIKDTGMTTICVRVMRNALMCIAFIMKTSLFDRDWNTLSDNISQ